MAQLKLAACGGKRGRESAQRGGPAALRAFSFSSGAGHKFDSF